MDRIVIMTDHSQGFDPLAKIAKALFPECRVEFQKKGQARNSAGGRRNAGARWTGRFREGAATEADRR
ncbi:MAG: hypothetical protein SWQ30_09720 [Thermodesulfobacteriota bacterium]|nr:hypothetical protein [Thermodesulfobacteriota bacterium]